MNNLYKKILGLVFAFGFIFLGPSHVFAGTVPTVVTLPTVYDLTQTSVLLQGQVTNTGGSSTFNQIKVGTLTGVLSRVGDPAISSTPFTFAAIFDGLSCNTTYSYYATAGNTTGIGSGATLSFTTLPCYTGIAPVVAVLPATSITQTSVVFNGKLVSNGGMDLHVLFEPGAAFNWSSIGTGGFLSATSSMPDTFSAPFEGINTAMVCGTTYTYRVKAYNSLTQVYSPYASFTTLPCPVSLPVVQTKGVLSVTPTSAVIAGNVADTGGTGGTSISVTPSFVNLTTGTAVTAVAPYALPTVFSATLSGLSCGHTYTYKAHAHNSAGDVDATNGPESYLASGGYGADASVTGGLATFTTAPCATIPTVITTGVTLLTSTTASITGKINSTGGASVAPGFTGLTSGTVATTPAVISATSTVPATFSATLSGLACGHTYTYKAVAHNSAGSSFASNSATYSGTTVSSGVSTFSTPLCGLTSGTGATSMSSGTLTTSSMSGSLSGERKATPDLSVVTVTSDTAGNCAVSIGGVSLSGQTTKTGSCRTDTVTNQNNSVLTNLLQYFTQTFSSASSTNK